MDNDRDQEINKKRKINNNDLVDHNAGAQLFHQNQEDDEFLTFSLSFGPSKTRHSSSPKQPQSSPPSFLPPPNQQSPSPLPLIVNPPQDLSMESLLSQTQPPLFSVSTSPLRPPLYLSPSCHQEYSSPKVLVPLRADASASSSRSLCVHRRPSQESETIPAPYPWATNQRATVHSLNYLLSNQIFKISGQVQCKRCDKRYDIEYDLKNKFYEVGSFIASNKCTMHDRAPSNWMNPTLPTCKFCTQENSTKPVIAKKKKSINWLFLLLGEMLGCCTLGQLKYFCKHTKNHRTGAKDRLLYLTYLGLCKQLDSSGPFCV